MKHIVHLTSAHPRYDTRIFEKECMSLANDYNVSLIVADGLGDEIKNGISIFDVGIAKNRRDRAFCLTKKVFEKALILKADLYHFHDPELIFCGLKLKNRHKNVIYDAHEDVAKDVLTKAYLPKFSRKIIAHSFSLVENFISKRLSAIVAATPSIYDKFIKVNSASTLVNNYPTLKEISLPRTNINNKKNSICFVGLISEIRGIKPLVDAMSLVKGDTRLSLVGPCPDADFLLQLKQSTGWSRVDYYGQVDRTKAISIMLESQVGVVTFLDAPNHTDAQPNKLFEYMAASIPVIASNFPLWCSLVEKNECGLCVNPESIEEIASAINQLIESPIMASDMGNKGYHLVSTKLNWDNSYKGLFDLYTNLLEEKI